MYASDGGADWAMAFLPDVAHFGAFYGSRTVGCDCPTAQTPHAARPLVSHLAFYPVPLAAFQTRKANQLHLSWLRIDGTRTVASSQPFLLEVTRYSTQHAARSACTLLLDPTGQRS